LPGAGALFSLAGAVRNTANTSTLVVRLWTSKYEVVFTSYVLSIPWPIQLDFRLVKNGVFELDFRGSMAHSIMHKGKSNKMQQCIKIFIIPYLYEAQYVSGTHRPSSGA
jgi:hypothetical protein